MSKQKKKDNPIRDPFGNMYWVIKSATGEQLRHRIDGPAVVKVNGTRQWWIEGKIVLEKNHPFVKLLKQYRLFSKWERGELTKDEKVLIKLSD